MNHKAKDTHHGGTAVVQLNGTLLKLGLFIVVVKPSNRKARGREVTGEGSLSLLPSGKLKEAYEGKHLESSGNGDIEGAGPALSYIREQLVLGGGDVTREVESGTSGDLAKEGKLADTPVLELDVTETVETLLVGIVEQSQRIEETKRNLSTELVLEGVESGGGLASLGRGESGGRADKSSDDGRLHVGNRGCVDVVLDKRIYEPSSSTSQYQSIH